MLQNRYIQNDFHQFQQIKHKIHTLPISSISKAAKYLWKPWLILALPRNGKVWIQNALGIEREMYINSVYNFIGLMSPRLWFNIWAVIIWVLIRKFLEIFGIYFDLAVKETSIPFRKYAPVADGEIVNDEQKKVGSSARSVEDKEERLGKTVADESLEKAEEATWVPAKQSRSTMSSESGDCCQRIC
jgi:hypothetical protein